MCKLAKRLVLIEHGVDAVATIRGSFVKACLVVIHEKRTNFMTHTPHMDSISPMTLRQLEHIIRDIISQR